jgi:formiminoglutamase
MHTSPDMRLWQGRTDEAEGKLGRRWHQVMMPLGAETQGVAFLGFACDAGVARNHGRVGAREGPGAIRAMLRDIPVRRAVGLFDAGNVYCRAVADEPGDGLEQAQEELSSLVHELLGRGLFPLILGGGHEMAYGSFSGLARHLAPREGVAPVPPRVGIINLDAHFDLRAGDRASSGTPFRQIAEDCSARGWPFRYCCLGVSEFANTQALFARARSLGAVWRRDVDMSVTQREPVLHEIDQFIASVDHLYLTICLDVLPASVAPGVSAPAARGVALEVIESIVDAVASSGKLRLADVAEMNPRFDIDGHTARVAARLVARVVEKAAM